MQRAARDERAVTIALVNDEDSPLARDADALLPLHAGAERSVAATKSMIASLVAGGLSGGPLERGQRASRRARQTAFDPGLVVRRALLGSRRSRRWPKPLRSLSSVAAPTHAVAAEAALKLKETSAIHAEAFSSAEVLHGPAGIIGAGFPVLAFAPAPADAAREGFFDALDRLASFGAAPLLIDCETHSNWQTVVALDGGHPLLTPIVALHAFYRVAEATARRRGRDPDQPPHLRKVTETL